MRLFFLFTVWTCAAHAFQWSQPYRNGRELHALYANLFPGEQGRFVKVPRDYTNMSRGQTEVYVWHEGDWDSQRPTAFVFAGGPGGSSHGAQLLLPGFNIMHVDARGTGFSRPETFEQYQDPGNYSSELIVRDVEFVRQEMGLEKISVYGVSYGTVPATMYGHLYPHNTRAVVLEGVVWQGDDDLWLAPHRQKILQRYYQKLPDDLRERVARYSDLPDLNPTWFATIARVEMYGNDFAENLTAKLDFFLGNSEDSVREWINSLKLDPADLTDSDHLGVSQVVAGMIGCRELSMRNSMATWEFYLKDGQFSPAPNIYRTALCEPLGLLDSEPHLYRASNYPLQVPVTYFQGGWDGATAAPNAIVHWKNVPQAAAQLFILPHGGHSPNLSVIRGSEPAAEMQKQIWARALNGEIVGSQEVKRLKAQGAVAWAYASRLVP